VERKFQMGMVCEPCWLSIAAHSWARRGGSDSFAVGGDDVSPSNSAAHGSQNAADGAFDYAIGLSHHKI
jgi:hypothetical protein